jgi:hypothetical protein
MKVDEISQQVAAMWSKHLRDEMMSHGPLASLLPETPRPSRLRRLWNRAAMRWRRLTMAWRVLRTGEIED